MSKKVGEQNLKELYVFKTESLIGKTKFCLKTYDKIPKRTIIMNEGKIKYYNLYFNISF